MNVFLACGKWLVDGAWRRLVFFILLSSISVVIFSARGAVAQTKENKFYCSGSGNSIITLVDVTTPYSNTDKAIIRRMLDSLLSSIQGGDRIVIRTISDSHIYSERLIERCIPYCDAGSTFGKLFNCVDGVIRSDTETVKREIIQALHNRLFQFLPKKNSDIIRTIRTSMDEDYQKGRKTTLLIYSDLIENSDFLPRGRLLSVSNEVLLGDVRKRALFAELRDAEVQVVGVGRDDSKNPQPLPVDKLNKLVDFWRAYFKESGAKSVSINHDLPSVR